ncbi:MAG: hypothetical protein V2A79_10170 [Planctomycetota bacterium]
MTANEVQDAVNDLIIELYRDHWEEFKHEPLNWGDLGCGEAREFKDGSWHVIIDEASPGECPKFCTELEMRLRRRGINAGVHTEW